MSDIPDSPSSFATDLQALREQAGKPTIMRLADETGISKSVVGDAFAGNRLPTEKTVAGLVRALGADPDPWLERRSALASNANANANIDAAPVADQTAAPEPRRTDVEAGAPATAAQLPPRVSAAPTTGSAAAPSAGISKRRLVTTTLAAALVSAAVTSGIWFGVGQLNAKPDPYAEIADGMDPMQTICRDDAVVAASEMRDRETQVQMMYSTSCQAVWGRVTRYDGMAAGNELTMSVYPAVDRDSERGQSVSAHDVQSVYTTLGISPETSERWCGLATMTAEGSTIDLGPELCI
ncbi:helix-turn-helix transcriptional regulator [Pseudoclavibacter sp. AY1F1]|uniref:helix-turn-helix domain-containing protein n=1 Tax=Pseudoclavibacter sp. AY1F1 TaxID=2080583 RepID=UPI0015E3E786|nr:helix-turn-helix transcriptional regulator [Pseudoclavibacter sp. AY1F1]